MLPEVGGVRPPRMLNKVDLPEPEEPTTARNSPLATSRSTPRRAWTSTSPTRKGLVSCRMWMMGAALLSGASRTGLAALALLIALLIGEGLGGILLDGLEAGDD